MKIKLVLVPLTEKKSLFFPLRWNNTYKTNTKWIAWRVHFQMRLHSVRYTHAQNFVIMWSEDNNHITNDGVDKMGEAKRMEETVRLALVNLYVLIPYYLQCDEMRWLDSTVFSCSVHCTHCNKWPSKWIGSGHLTDIVMQPFKWCHELSSCTKSINTETPTMSLWCACAAKC